MRRRVGDTQAAERRTWNSKSSDETSVTNADGVPFMAMARYGLRRRHEIEFLQRFPWRDGRSKSTLNEA